MKKEKKLTFFDGLREEEQQLLLSKGTEISVQKGTSLFLEGDEPNHIYLIQSGKVRLSKTSAEGKVLFFELKEKSDLVGELSLYNSLKVTFNAEVISDAIMIRYDRSTIEEICTENGDIAIAFMKWFSAHNNYILAQFRDLIFCGKTGALYSILIRLSNSHGKVDKDGIFINKKLTNQELANYVGATRESVSRMLKSLICENIISVDSKYITIHQIGYLQEHLRCEYCAFSECKL